MVERVPNLRVRPVRSYEAGAALTRLMSHESARLSAIGGALREWLVNRLSPEERELTAAIEERRRFLLESTREISVIDYGAGEPDSARTEEEMEKGVRSAALVSDLCKASNPEFWATFLFKLVRMLEPLFCVELGSSVGISASYLATALSINGKGDLITLEGCPEIAGIAEETVQSLNLCNASVIAGPFRETLKGILQTSKPVDFLFNDGHHDHDAVLNYFEYVMPSLSDEAALVFDDISWTRGMRDAWSGIEDDRRVTASIDLGRMGIALTGGGSRVKEKFRIQIRGEQAWMNDPRRRRF
jgi:predicted O-methyltransferase YrrM